MGKSSVFRVLAPLKPIAKLINFKGPMTCPLETTRKFCTLSASVCSLEFKPSYETHIYSTGFLKSHSCSQEKQDFQHLAMK